MKQTNVSKLDVKAVAQWIEELIKTAQEDESISISFFKDTKDSPLSIVGGWMSGFSADYNDLICISKSQPTYAMCLKVAVNEGPYAYTDFEMMDLPVDKFGDVEDTCVALNWDDDPTEAAGFMVHEWERLMADYVSGK